VAEDPDLTSADKSGAVASPSSGESDTVDLDLVVTGTDASEAVDDASEAVDDPDRPGPGSVPPAAVTIPPASPTTAEAPAGAAARPTIPPVEPPSAAAAAAARPVSASAAAPVTPPVTRPVSPLGSTPLTPPAAARPKADWAAEVADRIDDVVAKVRANTSDKLVGIARIVVYGLLAVILGLTAAVLLLILFFRLLAVIPGEVWIAYLAFGGLFVAVGLFLWSKKTAPAR